MALPIQEKKNLWNLPEVTLRPLNQNEGVFRDLIEAEFVWFKQCKMVAMPKRAEKLLLSEGRGTDVEFLSWLWSVDFFGFEI